MHRLVVGDFNSIRTYSSAEEIRRAFAVLAKMFQHLKIPVVLFETTAADPLIGDVADVLVEVSAAGGPHATFTDIRGGHRYQWPFAFAP